ncbi:glycosyltransferase family 2 protein [Flavobacterium sp. CYK-4]|uniref:glycosyltransferase n=1 Tax=Flavobacterium lotistagni TaxID=2709660 RepID=UPI00140B4427|nr:glycosyltransferase family 2 protein [Flavobacterium lotistagni]NHM07414.1 glycosyltransferase family 2 protein [Flavobacterium lotistagni]
MHAIELFLSGIEYSVYLYFTLSCLYVLVFSIAGHFYKKNRSVNAKAPSKIAVLIPAYKEDAVIVEVAKSALKQNYNSEKFDVVVIADSLKESTVKMLQSLPIILIEVSFEESTKAKALNQAMAELQKVYDYAVILDADNIMKADFLTKMNDAFAQGYQVVQGHRKAKNQNTSFAILDAASEEINNHIFRKGHRTLGFSSGLIGSGMGFDYTLFKTMMASVNAVGGFDKELEFRFAKNNILIEYLDDAVVLDEKIQKSADFSHQRRRWLSTQFIYLEKYFLTGFKELLLQRNFNFFDKLLQMVIPPRILLLGLTLLIALYYGMLVFVFQLNSTVLAYAWFGNVIITVVAFLLALPKTFYNANTLKALFSLPLAFSRMALLLFRLRGANKKFIHTAHGTIQN